MSLSTHVLDAVRGVPAAGIGVTLSARADGGWQELARGVTDDDGRIAGLAGDLDPGVHRLDFAVEGYFADSFYPEISISFRVLDGRAHHHVPLLLSPFAYSTYRGS